MTELTKALKLLMGGSTTYYVARNRVDDNWEIRRYKDDVAFRTCFDSEDEAREEMGKLDEN